MKKALSYLLTPVYFLAFGLLLLIFHPVQIICRNVWGYNSHKKSVDILNLLINKSLLIVGARIRIHGFKELPTDRPVIIVSNHQSQYDIPVMVWLFRKHFPKFIAKIELAKNIPSLSYNIRHSGAAIIDRKNGAQSVKEIIKLGRLIEKNNYVGVIFPEGTRAYTSKLKKFHVGGIKTLLKTAPSALVLPFAVDGNVNLHKFGTFPMSFGEVLNFTLLEPIEPKGMSAEEVVEKTEKAIRDCLSDNFRIS
jgi:1-acyl-sn-glycerol-3-phosphate acyltransferase